MQKIIKRTQRAVQRAEKRLERKTAVDEKRSTKKFIAEKQRQRAAKIGDIAAARKARIEDWNLGPLAPNRAVGRQANKYGAMTDMQIQPIKIPKHLRRKQWPIVEGDRVTIIKGPDKGKIGVIQSLNKDTETIVIDGLNMAYVDGSTFAEDKDEEIRQPRREFAVPIPYDDVRLVHKWADPRDNRIKDAIVEAIELRPMEKDLRAPLGTDGMPASKGKKGHYKDIETGEQLFERFVAGEGSSIPWPKKDKVPPRDFDPDTLRITAEETTFIPTLLIPPMPETVIDELRSKYSKFRHRHDEDYVEKMTAQDEASNDQTELLAKMRTPLQEHRARQQEAKKEAAPKILTDEMLARIGQVMSAHMTAPKTQPVVKVDRS